MSCPMPATGVHVRIMPYRDRLSRRLQVSMSTVRRRRHGAMFAEAQAEAVRLQDLANRADAHGVDEAFPIRSPLADLEAVLLSDPKVMAQFSAHTDLARAWQVSDGFQPRRDLRPWRPRRPLTPRSAPLAR